MFINNHSPKSQGYSPQQEGSVASKGDISTNDAIMQLQKLVGNQAVAQMLKGGGSSPLSRQTTASSAAKPTVQLRRIDIPGFEEIDTRHFSEDELLTFIVGPYLGEPGTFAVLEEVYAAIDAGEVAAARPLPRRLRRGGLPIRGEAAKKAASASSGHAASAAGGAGAGAAPKKSDESKKRVEVLKKKTAASSGYAGAAGAGAGAGADPKKSDESKKRVDVLKTAAASSGYAGAAAAAAGAGAGAAPKKSDDERGKQRLKSWTDDDLVDTPIETIFDQFSSYPELIASYVTGTTKRRLQLKMNEAAEAANLETVDLPGPVVAAARGLVLLIDELDQANKGAGSFEDKESKRIAALVKITEYASANAAVLEPIIIERKAVMTFMIDYVTESPDECNNVFASKIKPVLQQIIAGKPMVVRLAELMSSKGVKIRL